MRVVTYKTMLDEERKNILVKEDSCNYPNIRAIDGPEKIAELLNGVFHAEDLSEEHMWLLAVDTKCKVIGTFEIGHGTVKNCLLSPREVFVRACLCGASCIMLAHNHPSGEETPSKEDNNITRKIAEAGRLMDIPLLDHVIIGKGEYYSYAEEESIYLGKN